MQILKHVNMIETNDPNRLNWCGPVAYDHYANRPSDSLVREDLPTEHEYWLFSPALPALTAKDVSLQVQFDVGFASWNGLFYSTVVCQQNHVWEKK